MSDPDEPPSFVDFLRLGIEAGQFDLHQYADVVFALDEQSVWIITRSGATKVGTDGGEQFHAPYLRNEFDRLLPVVKQTMKQQRNRSKRPLNLNSDFGL